jgi:16S rRNA (cytidine1402-2'-O)-methyltransferase
MEKESSEMARKCQTIVPGLYIVATPIGNLGDITLRALDILRAADMVACEDTRVSGKLLSHFGIKVRTLSYHDHNADAKRPELLQELQAGKIVVLISDAGTPLISDPGYKLVKEAGEQGIKVFPIPGASSVTSALSVAGLPTDRFLFAGFLPSKAGARAKEIAELANIPATLVLFESVHRLPESLAALAEGLGAREAVICRELTKLHEELRRGTLIELAAHYAEAGEPKGEVVMVIAPPEAKIVSEADADMLLGQMLETLSVKDAASHVAKVTGLPRQELYARALAMKKSN